MDEKKLQEIMQDEEFVKELVKLKTREEVQELFKTKGFEIDWEELGKLESEGEELLRDGDLENVVGEIGMKTRIASCLTGINSACAVIERRSGDGTKREHIK